MNINITVQKIRLVLNDFLQNKLTFEDFIYIIEDIYDYEVDDYIPYEIEPYIKQNQKEEDLYYLLQTYDGDVRSYSPNKESQRAGCLNEEQLTKFTTELLNELNKYIKENNIQDKYLILNDIRNQKMVTIIHELLHNINQRSYWQKEGLIEDMEGVIYQLKQIKNQDKNKDELKLEKYIIEDLTLLKIIFIKETTRYIFSKKNPTLYNLIFPAPKDPFSIPDYFMKKVYILKKKIYFYLNPELENM